MPADSSSRPPDPQLPHRLRSTLGPESPQIPGPRPRSRAGAAPQRLQDQDKGLRSLLLSHQCPVVQRPKAPSVPGTAPGTPKPVEWARRCPPKRALASFPIPRRRAPRPAGEQGARLLPVQRGLRRGVRRVAGAGGGSLGLSRSSAGREVLLAPPAA